MDVIYRPQGRAGDYAQLACNIFFGCSGACAYCYAPLSLKRDRRTFHAIVEPRKNIVERFAKDSVKLLKQKEQGVDVPPILLCFHCDPYPKIEEMERVTRRVIETAKYNGLNVEILTKNGMRATRDFDLLSEGDAFATTLTCIAGWETIWEPGADFTACRQIALGKAKAKGLRTWVSIEPVIRPQWSLSLIRAAAANTDLFKIGKLNYPNMLPKKLQREIDPDIDWAQFARDAIETCEELGKPYLIKKDLRVYLTEETDF